MEQTKRTNAKRRQKQKEEGAEEMQKERKVDAVSRISSGRRRDRKRVERRQVAKERGRDARGML